MLDLIKKNKFDYILYIYLLLYTILNMSFLVQFPFVHSDESWLSGLSRNMLESKSLSVTESFFDLYPRNPHAIKAIFHSIQMVVIQFFGYSVFNMRMISLLFGIAALVLFYKTIARISPSEWLSMLAVILLSIDIQFIYASHFARQEIILLTLFLVGFYYNTCHIKALSKRQGVITGILVGVAIGIHPNSFMVALPFLFLYVYMLFSDKSKFSLLVSYIVTVSVFAIAFILLSFSFNSHFITDYRSYGETLGVTNSLFSKIAQLKYYLLKLYYGISGTYYTPDIQFQFFLFGFAFLISFYFFRKEMKTEISRFLVFTYLSIAGFFCGLVIVGRYNQTSIVFFFPLFYILIFYCLTKLKHVARKVLYGVLLCVLLLSSYQNMTPYLSIDYETYLNEISSVVPNDENVLANLNTEYYFNNKVLYDYRNLQYLKAHHMTFPEYIEKNSITYIIYPEEIDYIYNTRPIWNGLYGNVYPYYDDMQTFFREHCSLIHSFNSPYGIRIARFFPEKDWLIKIYKVSPTE